MINKYIKKVLKSSQVSKLKELNLGLRPSEINPKIFIKLLSYLRNNFFSFKIIFSI